MPRLMCLKSYTTRLQAEYDRSILEANGLPAIVLADDAGGPGSYVVLLRGLGRTTSIGHDESQEGPLQR